MKKIATIWNKSILNETFCRMFRWYRFNKLLQVSVLYLVLLGGYLFVVIVFITPLLVQPQKLPFLPGVVDSFTITLAGIFIGGNIIGLFLNACVLGVYSKTTTRETGLLPIIWKSIKQIPMLYLTIILVTLMLFGSFWLLIIPYFVLSVFFMFAGFEVVINKQNAWGAIRKSVSLARAKFWSLLLRTSVCNLGSFLLVILSYLIKHAPESYQVWGVIGVQLLIIVYGWYVQTYFLIYWERLQSIKHVVSLKKSFLLVGISLLGYVILGLLIACVIYGVQIYGGWEKVKKDSMYGYYYYQVEQIRDLEDIKLLLSIDESQDNLFNNLSTLSSDSVDKNQETNALITKVVVSLDKLLVKYPAKKILLEKKANALTINTNNKNNLELAITTLEQIAPLETDPNDTILRIASIHHVLGNTSEIIINLEKARIDDPNYLLILGDSYIEVDRYSEGYEAYSNGLKIMNERNEYNQYDAEIEAVKKALTSLDAYFEEQRRIAENNRRIDAMLKELREKYPQFFID